MKDARGIALEVGQKIAFADRVGNVARLRIGTISELFPEKGQAQIIWKTEHKGETQTSKVTVAGEYIKRPRIVILDITVTP